MDVVGRDGRVPITASNRLLAGQVEGRTGCLGIALLARPSAGQRFAAGVRQIALTSFERGYCSLDPSAAGLLVLRFLVAAPLRAAGFDFAPDWALLARPPFFANVDRAGPPSGRETSSTMMSVRSRIPGGRSSASNFCSSPAFAGA